LDLSDKYSWYCCLDRGGEVVEEGRVRTTAQHLKKRFGSQNRVRIAIEAGTHSPWVSRVLKDCGHDVVVANPRKLRLIYRNDKKSDRVDAQWLARIARMDKKLLAPIHHRGAQAQADLAVLRARDALVEARTKLINHVRGAVKAMGKRLSSCSTPCFHKKVAEEIPQELKVALTPLLDIIEDLTQKIREHDGCICRFAEQRYAEAKRLQSVPGVGPLTSVGYVLTIEDPRRFAKSRSVGSFFGLRPRQDDTGKQAPQLRITKAGDEHLRRLLVGSAQYILGPFAPDTDLRRWGLKLAHRGGKNAKKRAVVAVARKLAVLLHRLWISGESYDPLRNTRRQKDVPVPLQEVDVSPSAAGPTR
jgi:transposase